MCLNVMNLFIKFIQTVIKFIKIVMNIMSKPEYNFRFTKLGLNILQAQKCSQFHKNRILQEKSGQTTINC